METNTKKLEEDNGSKACSAARKVFYTPELLKAVLLQLEAEEFFKVQASHSHFMSAAMQFPALRYRFFLEEDPAAIGQASRLNPLFVKIIRTAGWWYHGETMCITTHPVNHVGYVRDWSTKIVKAQRLLDLLPPTMVLWSPSSSIASVRDHQGKDLRDLRWDYDMASARVVYNPEDNTLRAGIEAFLRAHRATPIPKNKNWEATTLELELEKLLRMS